MGSVSDGAFQKIERVDERESDVVYKASKVFNTLVLFDQVVKGDVKGTGDMDTPVGYPLVCGVCGNEIGFQRGNTYYLMNMIEEDGYCCCVC